MINVQISEAYSNYSHRFLISRVCKNTSEYKRTSTKKNEEYKKKKKSTQQKTQHRKDDKILR